MILPTPQELQARVNADVRGDKDLRELVALMPIDDQAKDAIWETLIVAYSLGMLAVMNRIAEGK